MKRDQMPTLDSRDAAQVFADLLAHQPAFLDKWHPAQGSPGWALLKIFSRYMEVIIQRLNQSPDKNLLAFLDQLGINLISAQAARAPVIFQPLPNATDGRIAAGTRLGVEVAEHAQPVMFETENAIALATARLVEVKTLWPARDAYAEHTIDAVANRPFTLFQPLRPVPHEFYLAHDTLFAFSGKTTLQIEFELATAGNNPLRIEWQHWDGQVWRPFKAFDANDTRASQDSTNGLVRSGTVTLRAECGRSVKKKVHGIEAHWVRGRLDDPLPPDASRVLPLIDRIGLRAVIEREFDILESTTLGSHSSAGLLPDHAFADGSELDTTKIFYPFGRAPNKDSTFYFGCDEIFSKPGADVTLQFRRAINPEDEADKESLRLYGDVNHARDVIIKALRDAAKGARNAAQQVAKLTKQTKQPLAETVETLNKAISKLDQAINDFPDKGMYKQLDTLPAKALYLLGKVDTVVDAINGIQKSDYDLYVSVTAGSDPVKAWKKFAEEKITACKGTAASAAEQMREITKGLGSLGPYLATKTAGTKDAKLQPPKLVWEYWGGNRWKVLMGPLEQDEKNFWFDTPPDPEVSPVSVKVSFRVPQDIAAISVNDVKARWVRVRLLSGSYNRLKLVSWYDAEAGKVNFFPIIEPRPPALDVFSLSYVYRSAASGSTTGTLNPQRGSIGSSSFTTRPEHCLTYNDFQLETHSDDVRWSGRLFPPFRPVADTTPSLYLGFDVPLPNDLIGLYLDVKEETTAGPVLVWEAWDSSGWRELSVNDETADLRRSGMVSFIAPQVSKRPQINGARAQGTELPRFGTPRDWVRARLRVEGKPIKPFIHGVYVNAAWAVQRLTIENEMLGSGTGQPGQVLFFTQAPVLPGEHIEIRELEGARAAVELPILKEELIKNGFTDDDIRHVADPVSGLVAEVWVRWRYRPHLFFSGPDDRHYMIERARGRLIFGDRQNGRIPPVGPNNIRVRRYQTGGGLAGNVSVGKITQLLSAASAVQAVTNPRAADGGAEGETPESVKTRGPQRLRHRGCSLATRDYEALAHESSPGVAAARALPATAPNGRPAAGWVTVIIVPQSQQPRPQPSFELRRQVHDYLAVRAPATVAAGRIAVIGPTYLPVGVAASVAPHDASEAGVVKDRVRATLEKFLHPLSGGPEGQGWPFGRHVYLSDVAAVLESVEGVDYVKELNLLLRDTPQGEQIAAPPDRIVVAGILRIEMQAAER